MSVLTLTAQEQVSAPPSVVFALFGAGAGAGWVFDAVCDRVAPGVAVTLRAPLDGDAAPVEILGRIGAVTSGRLIEIVHDQPWRGRTVLRFSAHGSGTRVRLQSELDQQGLEWLLRRRGHVVRSVPCENPALGLLTSKSGPGNLFAAASDNMAALALEEINADGGLHGRPVDLVIGDDATDPATGAREARRLVAAGCRTILVATTSATFVAVSRAMADADVLLIQTLMNEGGIAGALRVQLGERPVDQLAAAAGPMMRAAGGRRWFLAGNDYCWPRSTHTVAREVLPQLGGSLVGERLAPLGTSDFAAIIEAVERSGADLLLSTFVGADAAAFQRECYERGLHRRCLTLAPAMDESTLARIGTEATAGLHTVSGYVESLDTERNSALLNRYRERFGQWAPPLSTLSESVFEGVHMWFAAAAQAGTDEPHAVARAMHDVRFELPRGTVTLDGNGIVGQRIHVAEAVGTDLRVVISP
ncbi:substrate-binding protein [Pseudonocardia dioxanivorans]|uniref:Extracellular ligand-binding receptor n=1 Tax=Pseudonocardia dioxanivorans (strain ATCC 55486 / DSM 44775 / JCM 13855 / CB1190) TaxID=675635 RepID=F4CVU7_PSEUX|nr:substrate-binding protein [Pseudonocardia dioxanivorans]AEA25432.1 Extracellular ligand-binding receptor [Pseudonocardia dioxanivorans CB1190]